MPANHGSTRPDEKELTPTAERRLADRVKERYDRSFARDLATRLGKVEFGNQIILLGSSILLSVLPLILLLDAFANHKVEGNIVSRLGLNENAARIIDGLFGSPSATVTFAVVLALVVAFVGTMATARSVQIMYERAFEARHSRGLGAYWRCLVWIGAVAAELFFDAFTTRTIRDAPLGRVLLGLENLALLTLFFWWSLHFLLTGSERWRRLFPAALTTAVFWIGLAVFGSLYFPSTILSDWRLYGDIGVVFDLVTWFIAMAAAFILGAVVGETIDARISARS